MIAGAQFTVFLCAAVLLAVVPGPGILYVLGRTLSGGKREGVVSTLGTFVGGLTHVIAAAFGLSAVLVRSAAAFATIRYAGAAYLIYLGVMTIRSRHLDAEAAPAQTVARRPFVQGIATEVFNPKTALFFLSFIPQFVVPEIGQPVLQFLSLGIISVALNTAADLAVVFFAAALAQRIRKDSGFGVRQRAASGMGMIGLGIYAAVADRK